MADREGALRRRCSEGRVILFRRRRRRLVLLDRGTTIRAPSHHVGLDRLPPRPRPDVRGSHPPEARALPVPQRRRGRVRVGRSRKAERPRSIRWWGEEVGQGRVIVPRSRPAIPRIAVVRARGRLPLVRFSRSVRGDVCPPGRRLREDSQGGQRAQVSKIRRRLYLGDRGRGGGVGGADERNIEQGVHSGNQTPYARCGTIVSDLGAVEADRRGRCRRRRRRGRRAGAGPPAADLRRFHRRGHGSRPGPVRLQQRHH
mmetsp:Transcript_43536/g.132484  ORF Transcript_43536/g.132484 Transcript_43536/m.132484 type:complete len:257 (+) Transcript_43536:320-1090(+)